jgi:hypothetical protein
MQQQQLLLQKWRLALLHVKNALMLLIARGWL